MGNFSSSPKHLLKHLARGLSQYVVDRLPGASKVECYASCAHLHQLTCTCKCRHHSLFDIVDNCFLSERHCSKRRFYHERKLGAEVVSSLFDSYASLGRFIESKWNDIAAVALTSAFLMPLLARTLFLPIEIMPPLRTAAVMCSRLSFILPTSVRPSRGMGVLSTCLL